LVSQVSAVVSGTPLSPIAETSAMTTKPCDATRRSTSA
jgi:hypothetical protein